MTGYKGSLLRATDGSRNNSKMSINSIKSLSEVSANSKKSFRATHKRPSLVNIQNFDSNLNVEEPEYITTGIRATGAKFVK